MAKDIVDLLLVVSSLDAFDKLRGKLQDAEYIWCGEPVPGGTVRFNTAL